MRQESFQRACLDAVRNDCARRGIGTLGEKTLHSVLKRYLEPNTGAHEIPVGRYVADIKNERGIIEIQTRSFEKLRAKLEYFLEESTVTVVYPVPLVKRIIWIDEDGSLSSPRKSPKAAGFSEVLPELAKIKSHLLNKNLRVLILLLEIEEYRLLNGWSRDKKRGSVRYDRKPVALLDELLIESARDYDKLLPQGLPEEFTAKEFAKLVKLSSKKASFALGVLREVGAVEHTGSRGRAFVYRRAGK